MGSWLQTVARRLVLVFLGALAAAACDSDPLAGPGAPCHSSEDCAAGLLCDYGHTPHVCSAGQVGDGGTGPSDGGPVDMYR